MIWTLILFAHAGMLSDKDSMAMTNVTGFPTEQHCIVAGDMAKKMASTTTKVIKYTCVQVQK